MKEQAQRLQNSASFLTHSNDGIQDGIGTTFLQVSKSRDGWQESEARWSCHSIIMFTGASAMGE